MFERFTDRARQVVVLAQEEARQLNHDYVGTEHILLRLIREGHGVAVQVLVRRGIDIDLDRVRQQVIQVLHGRPGDVPPTEGSAFDEGEKTIAARETEHPRTVARSGSFAVRSSACAPCSVRTTSIPPPAASTKPRL